MRASPAECNSAIHRAQAPLLWVAGCLEVERWRAHFLYGDRDGRSSRKPCQSYYTAKHKPIDAPTQ